MILHLVRHPPPDISPGICYGGLDIGALQVSDTAAHLHTLLPPGLPVWSSPLRRCRELALALHPAPQTDFRLAEMNFGRWEGQAWDAIPRHELDAWAGDVAGYAPPQGESAQAVRKRALEFVASLNVPEAVVVTHAGVIRVLLAHWRGMPVEDWLTLRFAYGSATRIEVP